MLQRVLALFDGLRGEGVDGRGVGLGGFRHDGSCGLF